MLSRIEQGRGGCPGSNGHAQTAIIGLLPVRRAPVGEEAIRVGIGAVAGPFGVADARFAKPLDMDMIRRLAREHEVLVMIEEGSTGGFGSHVLTRLAEEGLLDNGLKVRALALPDAYLDHDKPDLMYARAGLTCDGILKTVFTALDRLGYEGWIGCEYRPRGETDDGLSWVKALGAEL